jgi:hypothetical protein
LSLGMLCICSPLQQQYCRDTGAEVLCCSGQRRVSAGTGLDRGP